MPKGQHWLAYGLGKLAEGYGQGLKQRMEMEQLLADRVMKQRQFDTSTNLTKQKMAEDQAQARLAAELKLLELGRGTTSIDALGNKETISGVTDVSVSPEMGLIKGPNFNPGVRTVIMAKPSRSDSIPRGKTPDGRPVYADSTTGQFMVENQPYDGTILPLGFTPSAIPATYQKDINAFSAAKRSTTNALSQLMADIERPQNKQQRKLLTGPGFRTSDIWGAGLTRRFTTDTENQAFFGNLRAAQSKELTDATGVQRGFQEIQFLEPATISPMDDDRTILYKGTRNIITHAINLQRAHNQLSKTAKYDTSQLGQDAGFNAEVIGKAMRKLQANGVDTSELINLLNEYGKTSNPQSARPKTVVQNGYTYTYNERTGQYE